MDGEAHGALTIKPELKNAAFPGEAGEVAAAIGRGGVGVGWRLSVRRDRQAQRKGAAAAHFALDLEGAAMLLDHLPRCREADTGARDLTAHVAAAEEALKHERQVLHWNTDARIR